jgi:hypothetical protein
LNPASYRPGLFLAIDNNQGKEKPMTKLPLDQAADAAREVLSKIEDVALAVKNDIQTLSGIGDAAETNFDDLYQRAELLCREIVDTLQLPSDPVALATVEAIDNLLALMLEAHAAEHAQSPVSPRLDQSGNRARQLHFGKAFRKVTLFGRWQNLGDFSTP